MKKTTSSKKLLHPGIPRLLPAPGPASRSPRIKKILVPVDFSIAGKPALRYAAYLASLTGARVVLLHVEECLYYGVDYGYLPVDFKKMRQELSLKAALLQRGVFRNLASEFKMSEGVAFEEIIRVSHETKSDLIVMTTHGYTGLRHILMGSTAERTVRYATCPVLVLRSTEHRKKRPAPMRIKWVA